VIDSVFRNNQASASGGGIFFLGSDQDYDYESVVANCLITDNISGYDGGGVSVNWYSDIDIVNTTIADNIVTSLKSFGGGLFTSYSSVTDVIDSIIWDNTAFSGSQVAVGGGDLFFPFPASVTISYSDIGPDLDPNAPSQGDIGDVPIGSLSYPSSGAVITDSDAIYGDLNADGTAKIIVTLVEPSSAKGVNWNIDVSADVLRDEVYQLQDQVLNMTSGQTPFQQGPNFTLRHRFVNQAGFSGEVTQTGLDELLANPLVAFIEPVRELEFSLAQAIPLANALETRPVFDGSGVSVAIVDSGVDYTHPRLGGGFFPNDKVIGGYDTAEDDADPMPAGVAHGTACAGIAAGDLGEFEDYIGAAGDSSQKEIKEQI
ncbi:hypothetical protein LCGC14_2965620, partial [marine sediment metagenome]